MSIEERALVGARSGVSRSAPSQVAGDTLGRQVGRGTMWAVLASLTMRFANIAITAVLARLLTKGDFGVFAVASAVFAIVASLAELGMGSAVARSATEPDEIAPTV